MKNLSLERWEQIDTLFAEALERPSDERTAYLRAACGEDPILYHEVLALLECDSKAEEILGESVTQYATSVLADLDVYLGTELDAKPGSEQIGPYRIVRVLGQGGVGTVYLADRADGMFERQVALKLVKRGMDTDEILRRFRAERQILAGLQHIYIAGLFDGGVADDGRPYLVMEYVEGRPIDAYCDSQQLSVNERLKLFQHVCDAVQYAHQNLVVHRDLKPSNILVSEDGQVKLLDFGIAKLLSDEADRSMPLTQVGRRVMTPAYAAPEQISGDAVTTSTDVYALGVVLYELLTGHRPARPLADGHATRSVKPPSSAVANAVERRRADGTTEKLTPEQVCRARRTNPDRLRRRLQGDLDTILLKTLRQEPDRRYASANALVEDIKRHLGGMPVQARPDSMGYRMTKFVRRHRIGVAIMSAFILLVAAIVTLFTVRVAEERNVARQERDKAEEVSAFLEGLFDASDPFAPERLDTLEVRAFLERGAEQIQHQLPDQPLIQAQMLTVMGGVYRKLGLFDAARNVLEQALHTQLMQPVPPLDLAATQARLAAVYKEQERMQEADSLTRLVLATRRALLEPNHPDVAAALTARGILLRDLANFEDSEPLFQEALAIYRQAYGEDDLQVLSVLNELAVLANDRGEYASAEVQFRELIAKRRAVLGDDHPQIAVTLDNLATVLRSQGKYDESEAPVREALAINRSVFGDVHPNIPGNLATLAAVYRRRGAYDEAERLIRESLAIQRRLRGDESGVLAFPLTNLGEVLREKRDFAGAEEAHREALRLVRQQMGDENPGVGIITGFVAGVLSEKGDHARAEPLFREALNLLRRVLPEGHERTSGMASGLGTSLVHLGRYEEAEPLLLEGYRGRIEVFDAADDRTQRAIQGLVTLYESWNKPDEAAEFRTLLTPTETP